MGFDTIGHWPDRNEFLERYKGPNNAIFWIFQSLTFGVKIMSQICCV